MRGARSCAVTRPLASRRPPPRLFATLPGTSRAAQFRKNAGRVERSHGRLPRCLRQEEAIVLCRVIRRPDYLAKYHAVLDVAHVDNFVAERLLESGRSACYRCPR